MSSEISENVANGNKPQKLWLTPNIHTKRHTNILHNTLRHYRNRISSVSKIPTKKLQIPMLNFQKNISRNNASAPLCCRQLRVAPPETNPNPPPETRGSASGQDTKLAKQTLFKLQMVKHAWYTAYASQMSQVCYRL